MHSRATGAARAIGLAAALFLCCAALRPAFADEAIVWATDGGYPPFVTALSDDGPTGLDREVAEAVCRDIGRTCRFVATSWQDLLEGLRQGRFDVGFSGLTRGTATTLGLDASRPYFTAEPRFLALRDHAGQIVIDSGTAVLGVLAGTPHAAYLETRLGDPTRLRRFPDEEELYLSLLGGGVDAIFADGLPLYEALVLHPSDLPVALTGSVIDDPDYFDSDYVFAFAPGDPLRVEIDRALQTLDANGTLARIVEHRLPGYAASSASAP